jgi:hypothetical protein
MNGPRMVTPSKTLIQILLKEHDAASNSLVSGVLESGATITAR